MSQSLAIFVRGASVHGWRKKKIKIKSVVNRCRWYRVVKQLVNIQSTYIMHNVVMCTERAWVLETWHLVTMLNCKTIAARDKRKTKSEPKQARAYIRLFALTETRSPISSSSSSSSPPSMIWSFCRKLSRIINVCSVVNLQSGSMTAEEFHSALQEATNFPLRGFVLPYLKHTLPSLQRDLSNAARASNQVKK